MKVSATASGWGSESVKAGKMAPKSALLSVHRMGWPLAGSKDLA
jgi:hypothetical protein